MSTALGDFRSYSVSAHLYIQRFNVRAVWPWSGARIPAAGLVKGVMNNEVGLLVFIFALSLIGLPKMSIFFVLKIITDSWKVVRKCTTDLRYP